MAKRVQRAERREEALTKESIVDAAIELLDAQGEEGLTFRTLAARLATGAGAIYWHVANKEELLVAATDAVVSSAMAEGARDASPREAIRAVASSVFDAVHAHPWAGMHLARAPSQWASLHVFERLGRAVHALGVPHARQFTAASALLSYVLGVATQNTANARSRQGSETNRAKYLDEAATTWASLDAERYPFIRTMAGPLREHDDRAEFLAGIDLLLAGIAAPRR